jgi:hypothetical protein
VRQDGLIRLLMLMVAAACVAIALRALPAVSPPSDLQPTIIVNDTGAPVDAVHCGVTCAGAGVAIDPGHELRAGPPGSRWQLRTPAGDVIGCVSGTRPGQRLPVTGATGCAA